MKRIACSRAAAMLILIRFLLPATATAGEATRMMTGADALRRELSAMPPGGAGVTLFGPDDHLKDLFLPLFREKKAGSLVVVVPSEIPLGEENLAAWKRYTESISPGAGELFVLRDGALEGKLDGFAVRVVAVGGWKGTAGGGPVILDLSFLLAIYKDEVRTPFVDLPRKFMATLEDRGVSPSALRAWVADRDRIPLPRGYLPKLVAEVARDPAAFRGEIPAKWAALRRGEYLAFFSAYEEALPHFENYLKEEPEDPAVLFTIAQMHFVDREVERGLRFLKRACKADPYYVRGYAESALQFFRAGKLENAERVLRAGLLQSPSAPELKLGLAHVLLEQAVKMLPGDPAGAEARFAEIPAVGLDEESLRPIRERWAKEKVAPQEGSRSGRTPAPETVFPHGHGHPARAEE